MTGACLRKKMAIRYRDTDTQGRRSCAGAGRDQRDAATSQGILATTRSQYGALKDSSLVLWTT